MSTTLCLLLVKCAFVANSNLQSWKQVRAKIPRENIPRLQKSIKQCKIPYLLDIYTSPQIYYRSGKHCQGIHKIVMWSSSIQEDIIGLMWIKTSQLASTPFTLTYFNTNFNMCSARLAYKPVSWHSYNCDPWPQSCLLTQVSPHDHMYSL